MIDTIERDRAYDGVDRQIGGWRVVVSAWGLVLLFLLLFAGVSAVACPRSDHPSHRHLAAAAIPHHHPCVGPGLPSAAGVDGCKVIPLGQGVVSYAGYW
jgi:hypothetical protein